jgi:hypothetical protein
MSRDARSVCSGAASVQQSQAGRQGVVKEREPVAVDIVTGRLLRAPGA